MQLFNRRNFTVSLALAILVGGLCSTMALELAVSQSGRKVVLKNDGTWEPYDPERHFAGADIRQSGPVVELFVKYKNHGFVLGQRRTELQADGIAGKALEDSLRRVPKGGVVYIQMSTDKLNKADPRNYTYTVRDQGNGKVLVKRDGSEREAVDSDDVGISNLAVLPITNQPRGDLQIIIEDRMSRQVFEYLLPRGGE